MIAYCHHYDDDYDVDHEYDDSYYYYYFIITLLGLCYVFKILLYCLCVCWAGVKPRINWLMVSLFFIANLYTCITLFTIMCNFNFNFEFVIPAQGLQVEISKCCYNLAQDIFSCFNKFNVCCALSLFQINNFHSIIDITIRLSTNLTDHFCKLLKIQIIV